MREGHWRTALTAVARCPLLFGFRLVQAVNRRERIDEGDLLRPLLFRTEALTLALTSKKCEAILSVEGGC